mgnify:CR=1 FL=1
MNRIFLVLLSVCLVSCATTKSAAPLLGATKSSVSMEPEETAPEPEQVKPKAKAPEKAVVLLNQLFNTDDANKHTALIINNDSDCDFIMTVQGGKSYSIPVSAKKTESIVVEKGDYVLRSDVCNTTYLARKSLSDNTQVNIKFAVVKTTANAN